MTHEEAKQWLADHDKLSQQVFGHGTDARIEKRGSNWVGILPTVNKKSTVEQAIELLEDGIRRLKASPFALESVMNEIDEFWGLETGRLEKDEDGDTV